MNTSQPGLEAVVRRRLANADADIARSLSQIASGNPLGSETDPARLVRRLQTKAQLSREEAEIVALAIRSQASTASKRGATSSEAMAGAEAIRGATLDFVGVAFFTRGRRAADAVARVAFRNGRPLGSGFLVAPGLFLSNNHVIAAPARAQQLCIEFDYELDHANTLRGVTRFALDPTALFVFDEINRLDYALVAVGERIDGPRELKSFGYVPLSDASDKHALGEVANVVQHPQGRYKELVLRENRLVSRPDTEQVLHYVADTEQGSSGSPVFNNEWQAIALHHWGGPHLERRAKSGTALNAEINEGIRISAIVKDLRAKLRSVNATQQRRLDEALRFWASLPPIAPLEEAAAVPPSSAASAARSHADGSITWTFPVEINVRAPLLGGADVDARRTDPKPAPVIFHSEGSEARREPEDFSNRGGYEAGFLPGFLVALPALDRVPHRAARNLDAARGDDPHELRYHHFSIVMNAERRLAYFTACNIDGARIKAIKRADKSVKDDPTLHDLDIESLTVDDELPMEGAEASDAFRPDDRIDPKEQMARAFYENQNVPGHPDPQSNERKARMFQKGHIIMRGDPGWGVREEAVAAEKDTFFYTNAAPQVGFFNQGSRLDRPGSKGKLRWRAVETYVLRNAVAERQRISVFAGPVFNDKTDPKYRFKAKIPMQFWKIAVWVEDEALRSIALLADQSSVLEVMPEAPRRAGARQGISEHRQGDREADGVEICRCGPCRRCARRPGPRGGECIAPGWSATPVECSCWQPSAAAGYPKIVLLVHRNGLTTGKICPPVPCPLVLASACVCGDLRWV